MFIYVHVARKEAELLATQTLVRCQFALLSKTPEGAKSAYEAYQNYAGVMFPMLERAANTTVDDHTRLMEHVKYPMRIDVQAIRYMQAEQAKQKGLRKFQLKENR